MAANQGDWAGKILGFFFGSTLVVVGLIFLVDRAQAILTPTQYAEAKVERAAADAAAEAHQAKVDAAEALARTRRDESERKEALAFELASKALVTFQSSLRDPDAARFNDVWAVRGELGGTEIIAACGVVNATNGLGGYVGDTPFMAAASRSYTPEHPSFAGLFRDICLEGEKVTKLR